MRPSRVLRVKIKGSNFSKLACRQSPIDKALWKIFLIVRPYGQILPFFNPSMHEPIDLHGGNFMHFTQDSNPKEGQINRRGNRGPVK